MPAGLASLVLQVQAFFTVGFAAVLLRERPRLAQAAGLAAGDGRSRAGGERARRRRDARRLRARDRRRGGMGHRQHRDQARRPAGPAAVHDLDVRDPAAAAARAVARLRGPGGRSATRSPASTSAGSPPSPTSRSRPPRSAGACGRTCCARTRPARSRRSRCSSRCSGSASRRSCSASRSTVRTVVAAALVVSGVLLTQRAPRISPQIAGIWARGALAWRSARRIGSPQTRRSRRKERGHRGERPAAPSATVLALAQRAPRAAPSASFSCPSAARPIAATGRLIGPPSSIFFGECRIGVRRPLDPARAIIGFLQTRRLSQRARPSR